jgi:hypothetical protein
MEIPGTILLWVQGLVWPHHELVARHVLSSCSYFRTEFGLPCLLPLATAVHKCKVPFCRDILCILELLHLSSFRLIIVFGTVYTYSTCLFFLTNEELP